MLEDAAEHNFEHIVSWVPRSNNHGFIVHKPKLFAQVIMKRYFTAQNHYKSFLRQLNLYGFERIAANGNKRRSLPQGAYCHPLFIRGKPDLSACMDRPRARNNKRLITEEDDSCDSLKQTRAVIRTPFLDPIKLSSIKQEAFCPFLLSSTAESSCRGSVGDTTESCLKNNTVLIPDEVVDDIICVFGRRIVCVDLA
jgi:HSF-type DNA-binding